MSFRIDWRLPAGAWQAVAEARRREPPASPYDRGRLPLYELLTADVQVEADGRLLFPPGGPDGAPGFNLSLLDLAVGLERALAESDFVHALAGARATFRQSDDQLEISCEKGDAVVYLDTNLDRSPTLEVPEDEFLAEVERLRSALVAGLEEHAHEALEWETLAPLKR